MDTRIGEIVDQLETLTKELQTETTKRNSELSEIDKEVTDIYHYIEFNDLSASKGYKAYKDLQNCLRKRRVIKNDLAVSNSLGVAGLSSLTNSIVAAKSYVNKSYYSPRVREDLFPDAVAKTSNVLDGKKIIAKLPHNGGEKIFDSLEAAQEFVTTAETNSKGKETIRRKIFKAAVDNKNYFEIKWRITS